MKRYWLLLICFSGCMGNDGLRTDAVSDNNTRNLSRISEGMVECEIVYIMGKPFEYRTFEAEGSVYDIWFYIVRPTVLGQTRMVHQNLVPLTFKDGFLVGWGYHYYQKALAMQKAKTAPAAEPEVLPESEPNKPEEENIELEKALQTPPNQTPAAPQKTNTPAAPQKTTPQPVKKSPPPTTLGQLPGRDPNQDEPAAIQTQRQPTPVQPNQPPKPKTPVQPNQKPAVKPNQTAPKAPLQPNQPAPNQQPKPQPPANPKQKISMAKKPEQEPEEPKEDAPQVDEEGSRMLDQESEQDFDFW